MKLVRIGASPADLKGSNRTKAYRGALRALFLGLTVLTAGLFNSGCALLPQEAERPKAPMVSSFTPPSYALAECRRRDLVLTDSVSFTYVPVLRQDLHFAGDRAPFDEYLVEMGEAVTQGQLLAQLRTEDLPAQIEAQQLEVERRRLALNHATERQALELARCVEGTPEYDRVLADTNREIRSANDHLRLAGERLAQLESDLAERQIFAPFDGTITYRREIETGGHISGDDRILTVSDSSRSVFRADTSLWSAFKPEEIYVIRCSDGEYEAVLTDEAALGLEPTEHVEGQRGTVYLQLLEEGLTLKEKASGRVTVELDRAEGCLSVPASAVSEINGQSVVYILTDNEIRSYKEVETGITVDGYTEILKGLEEGEYVIAN